MKLAILCCTALLLAACAKNIDTPEAVKQGVVKDIAKKVDLQSMDINVDSVSFREKEADAKVSFKPKGADRSQAITMSYTLERQGDEWQIKNRTMDSHQMDAHGQAQAGQAGMPPGHPGTGSATPLPAGHPPVDRSEKQTSPTP